MSLHSNGANYNLLRVFVVSFIWTYEIDGDGWKSGKV